MRTRDLVRKLKYARTIHSEWAQYLRGDPVAAKAVEEKPLDEIVGTPEWHEQWVGIYDSTLKRLGVREGS